MQQVKMLIQVMHRRKNFQNNVRGVKQYRSPCSMDTQMVGAVSGPKRIQHACRTQRVLCVILRNCHIAACLVLVGVAMSVLHRS